ncbi:hypothetical protein Llac01_03580 [Leuconostoc lactis]|uniref:glycosyltransferase family 2 protein n=1 Tax=Leuconostoc lactis TaxID=1246 RepID=UPI0011416311|nr:glycosyltransferase [Leuconostoc lactis]GEB41018.1 hypothetical protein LLA04_14060 [Leuconostoc lactis]GLY44981.1 hypothetical protein Llac01_03580 [Leuconostoc lactis]
MVAKLNNIPLVSIIMPVYNVENFVEQSLASVFAQKNQNYELIIIVDGSTDNSRQLISRIVAKKNNLNIQIIETENKGLSAARNRGILESHGKYIFFFDSDDYLDQNFLSTIVPIIENGKEDVILFNYREVEQEGMKVIDEHINTFCGELSSEFIIDKYLAGKVQNYAWSFIAKKEIYINNNIIFPEGKAYEDVMVFPKIIFFARHISVISEILYNYRRRKNSITSETNNNKTVKYLHDYLVNIQENKIWMLQNFNKKNRKNIYRYCLNHLFQIFMIASTHKTIEYQSMAPVVNEIIEIERIGNIKKISLKKRIIIFLMKMGLGSLVFKLIQFKVILQKNK